MPPPAKGEREKAPMKTPEIDPPIPVDLIKLVAIDLDGTLLRSNKRLSTANARAIAEVTHRGVHVVLASARPPRGVRDIYHRLSLDTLQVNYNGALIHDMPRGKHVFHQPMSIALAKKIVKFARKMDPDVVISVEVLDKWYTDHVDDKLPTETSKHFSPNFVGPLSAFLTVPVTKLMLLAPPKKLKPIHEGVRKKFGDEIAIMISDDYLIQLVHKQVDKASALMLVAEQFALHGESVTKEIGCACPIAFSGESFRQTVEAFGHLWMLTEDLLIERQRFAKKRHGLIQIVLTNE